jgi:uncharacterized membrane protein
VADPDETAHGGGDVTPRDPGSPTPDPASPGAPGFVVEAEHRGPLPPPEMLNDYNNVLPGLAERIVRMAESEQKHMHQVQRWYVASHFTGQAAAFLIALAGLVVGGLLIDAGHNIAGLATLFGGLAPVVGAFLYRQVKSSDN